MVGNTTSLKLLIDTQGKRALFAEASKDFVDFLIRILSLPVATVVSLVQNPETVGSLANPYASIQNMDDSYILPNQSKISLLKPSPPVSAGSSFLVLALKHAPIEKVLYSCNHPRSVCYFSDDSTAVCPYFGGRMTAIATYVVRPGNQEKVTNEG